MDVSIQKYLAFVETVDCGSFTRAAEKLHYSQSGVSRMIRDLETEWQVTLLDRGKGGVKLTSDGQKLLPFARSVCTEHARLQKQVEELSGLRSGLIRMGVPQGVAAARIPGWIQTFQEEYPGIDYELLVGERREIEAWIAAGRVDLGILSLPASPELETVFLEQDPLLAVLPQGFPGTEREVFPVSAFVDLPFLLPSRGEGADAAALLESCGIEARVKLTTGDEQAILSLVERGMGVSILSALSLERCAYRVEKRRLDVPAYRNLGVAMRKSSAASMAVRRFLSCIEG